MAYLQRAVYNGGYRTGGYSEEFDVPEGVQIVDVEWDEETVIVTYLMEDEDIPLMKDDDV